MLESKRAYIEKKKGVSIKIVKYRIVSSYPMPSHVMLYEKEKKSEIPLCCCCRRMPKRSDSDERIKEKDEKEKKKYNTKYIHELIILNPPTTPPLLQRPLHSPHHAIQQQAQPLASPARHSLSKAHTTQPQLNPHQQTHAAGLAERKISSGGGGRELCVGRGEEGDCVYCDLGVGEEGGGGVKWRGGRRTGCGWRRRCDAEGEGWVG